MTGKLKGIRACVFDAYGTLFDVNAAAANAREALGPAWQPLAEIWRNKQLQYTWLRSLMDRHADFWQVTEDALDFALASLKIDDQVLRRRLLDLYLELDAYPEVKDVLGRLGTLGVSRAILSNGSPRMLAAAVRSAGLDAAFDAVLSVEAAGVFKPSARVYQLAVDRFKVRPADICFISSNGWDAFAAKAFGFRVLWCNRSGQPVERMPEAPDGEMRSLAELPDWIGAA